MTRNELKQKIDAIIAVGHDDERAHGEEDRLHIELIKAYCPKWVCAEIDRLSDADFGRWCG